MTTSSRKADLIWLGVATLVMLISTFFGGIVVGVVGVTSIAWKVVIVNVSFLVGGVFVGWLSKKQPTREAGAGAFIIMIVSLVIASPKVANPVLTLFGMGVALVVAAGVGAAGALIGKELRRRTPGATDTSTRPPDAWDQAGDWLAAHGALPALGIITIVVFIVHAGVFRGETAGDDLTFHFAESVRLADCLRAGDFDFWNQSANAGYASAYYYQVLPQLASAIPSAIFGHDLFWFQLSVVLPLVLAPACAYRGMRLLGATPWQAAMAAFAIAFMNGESRWGSGNAGTFQVGLYTQTWALCAFPIALGYCARWISAATNLAPAVAWGGFVFLCHPFAGASLGLAIFAGWIAKIVMYAFARLTQPITSRLRPLLPKAWLVEREPQSHGGVFEIAIGAVIAAFGVTVTVLTYDAAKSGGTYVVAYGPIVVGVATMVRGIQHFKVPLSPEQRAIGAELLRGAVLAVALFVTWLPVLLPLTIDSNGFGGFPHRVGDEVGPGFGGLWTWYYTGAILDWLPKNSGFRIYVLTIALPIVIVFARASFLRWLWAPALLFALLLGLGPHMGKIGDDLFPPVRALGAMQTVLALGIGAGALIVGMRAWRLAGEFTELAYGLRTVLAAIAAALIVLVAVPGARALAARVHVLGDYGRRAELLEVNKLLAEQPAGRKQVGTGAENHWWNLLSYAYERVPALLQMGGGGLQASPNYDFLWTNRDYVKNAWIFDAPYLVFDRSKDAKMPVGETLARTEHYEIRELPTDGLVSPVQIVGVLPPGYRSGEPGRKAALDWIKGDQPMQNEVLAYEGYGTVGAAPDGKTLRAWHQDSPGDDADIVAEVEAEKPTTFVVRESWHPRWRAYIDDNEVRVLRVTPDFPAVEVPAGKHTIALRFERPWWAQAVWLAWPGTALIAWLLTRRRRATKT